MACSARKAANEAGQLMHKQRPFLVEALTAIGLIVAPFVLPHIGFAPNTVNRILVWGLFGLGFDILFGFTGLLSFGQSAFYGTGGFVAAYLLTRAGFPNVMLALIIGKQIRMEGFIVSTYWDMMPAFAQDLAKWHASGQLKWKQTVREGIEKAPDAFIGLFSGENFGKMLVKLA